MIAFWSRIAPFLLAVVVRIWRGLLLLMAGMEVLTRGLLGIGVLELLAMSGATA